MRISVDDLRQFSTQVLMRCGLSDFDAREATESLVWASLRGVDTHGVRNLKRYYVEGIKNGSINPRPQFRTEIESPLAAKIDADSGLGIVAARHGMRLAIEKARDIGAGFVSVRHTHHLGAAGCYAHMAAEQGMLGLCMTGYFFPNGQSGSVLPYGGALPMFSTNPFAFACPAGKAPPFVLDMATSTVPINRLELLGEKGLDIPSGWGLDAQGAETSDPAAVKQLTPLGGLEHLGGQKGFGLAMLVQIFTGLLSGAWRANPAPEEILGDKKDLVHGYGQQGIAHFLGAIRIDQFGPLADFQNGLDTLIQILNESPARPPHSRVTVAGQLEGETVEERTANGVPLPPTILTELQLLSSEFEIPLPARDEP